MNSFITVDDDDDVVQTTEEWMREKNCRGGTHDVNVIIVSCLKYNELSLSHDTRTLAFIK
jgi:hypothetical protein